MYVVQRWCMCDCRLDELNRCAPCRGWRSEDARSGGCGRRTISTNMRLSTRTAAMATWTTMAEVWRPSRRQSYSENTARNLDELGVWANILEAGRASELAQSQEQWWIAPREGHFGHGSACSCYAHEEILARAGRGLFLSRCLRWCAIVISQGCGSAVPPTGTVGLAIESRIGPRCMTVGRVFFAHMHVGPCMCATKLLHSQGWSGCC